MAAMGATLPPAGNGRQRLLAMSSHSGHGPRRLCFSGRFGARYRTPTLGQKPIFAGKSSPCLLADTRVYLRCISPEMYCRLQRCTNKSKSETSTFREPMAETINIAKMAEKLSKGIFGEFLWQRMEHTNLNWPCEDQETHEVKTHPSDVVFWYDEPYSQSRTYVNCDLKSYASHLGDAHSPLDHLVLCEPSKEQQGVCGLRQGTRPHDGGVPIPH